MFEIKTILPVVTLLVGVYLAPYIEKRKNKAKANEIYDNLKLELNDEIGELPNRLMNFASCLDSLTYWEEKNEPKINQPWFYIPRETSCYFLKSATENSFQLLTKEQRYAAKSLQTQLTGLVDYCLEIKENKEVTKENRTLLKNCYKKYLFTGCCALNTMRVLAGDSKGITGKSDAEIIDQIFSEIGIQLAAKDLYITHKRELSD
ncbi:hypothetical protein VIVU109784_22160 [Vibrio vulnificus]|nr:hypothetical protein [Vibrio vulnificus]QBN14154.1 hypothetical protein E2I22_08055 [Vibrio vulnificus]